jgi:hypothetical protein
MGKSSVCRSKDTAQNSDTVRPSRIHSTLDGCCSAIHQGLYYVERGAQTTETKRYMQGSPTRIFSKRGSRVLMQQERVGIQGSFMFHRNMKRIHSIGCTSYQNRLGRKLD